MPSSKLDQILLLGQLRNLLFYGRRHDTLMITFQTIGQIYNCANGLALHMAHHSCVRVPVQKAYPSR